MATMASTAPHIATAARARHAKQTRPQLVVEIRSRSSPYARGSGPPPLPVTLMPAHDSTAFIVDRILLGSPGLAQDGQPLPRRMTYIVGWRDLPAARVLVPAMSILDYVSPWELEQWEYNFEVELEEERAQLAADKEREKQEDATQAQQDSEDAKRTKKKKKTRKRGRPPTHEHTQIEAGAMAVPETEEEASRARLKPGTMSLSTPQKTRMADFEDLSDDEGTPSRQMQPGSVKTTGREKTMAVDENDDTALVSGSANGLEPRKQPAQSRSLAPQAPKITPVPLPQLPLSVSSLHQRTLPKMFTTMSAESGFSSTSSSKSTTPVPLPVLPPLRPSQGIPPVAATQSNPVQPWTSYQNGPTEATARTPKRIESSVLPPTVPPSAGSTPSVDSRPTSSISRTTSLKPTKKRKRKDKPLLDDNGMPVWHVKRIEDDAVFEIEGKGIQRLYKVRWEGDWPPEENPTWEPAANLPANMVRNWHKTAPKVRSRLSRGLNRKSEPARPHSAPASSKRKPAKMKQSRLDWGGAQKLSTVSDVFQSEADNVHSGIVGHEDMNIDTQETGQQMSTNGEQDDELFVVDSSMEAGKGHGQILSGPRAGERSGFAARMSSWGAFFGGRS